jgi:hypothetical protein
MNREKNPPFVPPADEKHGKMGMVDRPFTPYPACGHVVSVMLA